MITALLVRKRFETWVSKCMDKSFVSKVVLFAVIALTVGCADTFEDGETIVPSPDQQAEMVQQEEAVLAFFKDKKNVRQFISTSQRGKNVRRIARAS